MLWFLKYFGWHLVLSVWSSLNSPALIINESPVAEIPSLGNVVGSVKFSESGRKYHSFRGIPYAEPPIGDLRFKVS